jgi:hypothetical protein
MKLTPFCLKSFAVTTFTEREHQAIELVDHTHWKATFTISAKIY